MRKGETGQDLIEYALVLPLFLLLMFGIIEFAQLFFTYVTISNAAREGARASIVAAGGACSTTTLESRAAAAIARSTSGIDSARLTRPYVSCPTPTAVRVTVRYAAPLFTAPLVRLLGAEEVPLRAVATMGLE